MVRSGLAKALILTGGSAREPNSKNTENELHKLSGEINWYEEEARKAFALALQYKLEIGKRLMRAKEVMPHGNFLSWAQSQFGWTPRHVQSHLTIAQNAKCVALLPAGTSMRMALAAIRQLRFDAAHTAPAVEVIQTIQRIHLIGEIDEGALDKEELLRELTKIAARLGAPRTRWRAR